MNSINNIRRRLLNETKVSETLILLISKLEDDQSGDD